MAELDPELVRVIFRATDATVIGDAAAIQAALAPLLVRYVWIVRREVMYAEGEHLGVYATAELAMAAHPAPAPTPIWCTQWRQARASMVEGGHLLEWWWRDDGGDTINAERHEVHSAAERTPEETT